MKRAVLCVFLSVIFAKQAFADEKHATCLTTAMDTHLQISLKLFETEGIAPSPDKQIMRRRIFEKYCLEVTACGLQSYKGESVDMVASALFSSCLDEEKGE